jgi:sigma-B regulation protein RsbU (phosphoserine phosphatase)
MDMKILVVDDRPVQLAATTTTLNELGHSVTATDSCETALELLVAGDHQTVIVNRDMHRTSGTALCQRIRKEKFVHYIYVILLTEHSDQPDLTDGVDVGVDDFLCANPDHCQLAIRLRTAERFLEMEQRLVKKHWDLAIAHNTIRADLENAARTQLALLPKPIYAQSLKAWWAYRPAIFCGGDTFNFFSPLPDIWFFHSIDVSGHGLSAAMLSIHLQAHINSMSHSLYGGDITTDRLEQIPATFARNLNTLVAATDSDHYLTMLFGIIDLRNCVIYYVQAGHPHPYHYRSRQDELQLIETNGYPIGLLNDADWHTEQLTFEPGDRLIVYSDGLLENAQLNNASACQKSKTEKLHSMFDCLSQSNNGHDLERNVAHCICGTESKNNITDDINVLIFEYPLAA